MFASWAAGDYGAVGATEWLEVGIAVCVQQERLDLVNVQLITFHVLAPTGLFVFFEYESLLLH